MALHASSGSTSRTLLPYRITAQGAKKSGAIAGMSERRKNLRWPTRRDSVARLPTGASRGMAGNGISTVMMKGIFDEMAEGHQLPKRVAQDLLSSMIEKVTRHLKQGDRIRIAGLG